MLRTSKWVTRRNLQTQPKIIIKLPEYQIENFPDKSMYSTLKAKTSSKFVLWQPDEIYRIDSKSLKNYRNTKSTNQNINFPKTKYV
jgi:TnpA family transposase